MHVVAQEPRAGWFLSSRAASGHLDSIDRHFREARLHAGLSEELVLYCARHDFGSYVLERTGNLKAVMDSVGHQDVKTAMKYQHPELELVRQALNSRHTLRHTGENGSWKN